MNNEGIKRADAQSYDAKAAEFGVLTEKYSTTIAGHMLDLALIRREDRLLDVGTGTGLLARMAAERGAQAIGIDHSEQMVETAGARAREQGLEAICEFRVLDAEDLQLDDADFDVVTSLYVLLHLPNPEKAVREMHRVLRERGRIVITVGARPPILSLPGLRALSGIAQDRLSELGGKRLIAPRSLRSFLLSEGLEPANHNPAHGHALDVGHLLKATGFSDIRSHWRGERFCLTPEEFWEVQSVFDSEARIMLTRAANRHDELKDRYINFCREHYRHGRQLVYRTGAMVYTGTR